MVTRSAEAGRGRWIGGWDPEDEQFWEESGRRIARRNLLLSILSEHIGLSVWSIWSVLVLFMSPEIGLGFEPGEKFLLVTMPALVGALLRIPYSYGVTRFGGRNWTVFSTSLLLVPMILTAFFVTQPGTPLWVFLLIGALTGAGGGNFASSMTNITAFFPQRRQGWALGLNAGGGNMGVAVVQLVGLLVIAAAGSTSPVYVAAAYLPLIVVAAVLAATRMDNIDAVRREPGTLAQAARAKDTWWLSLLYVGTFGSFIGYSFAFGLVLQNQFDFTALQAACYTFAGPLLGSLARPLGGRLADRWGGARVTYRTFTGMAAGTAVLLVASGLNSFPLYLASFVALFVLTGIGNGSVYKMIPATFAQRAGEASPREEGAAEALVRVRRLAGAAMGIAGSVGALGGVFINLAFRASFSGEAADGDAALVAFLAFYTACIAVIRLVYLRRERTQPAGASKVQAVESEAARA